MPNINHPFTVIPLLVLPTFSSTPSRLIAHLHTPGPINLPHKIFGMLEETRKPRRNLYGPKYVQTPHRQRARSRFNLWWCEAAVPLGVPLPLCHPSVTLLKRSYLMFEHGQGGSWDYFTLGHFCQIQSYSHPIMNFEKIPIPGLERKKEPWTPFLSHQHQWEWSWPRLRSHSNNSLRNIFNLLRGFFPNDQFYFI